jgi:quercetin dioxygenase-like cupin family protein
MRSERQPLILKPDSTERFDWTGKPLELLGESEHTAGLYTIQRATVHQADGSIAGHRHGFGESFYLLSGSLEFFAGNRFEILRSGDFIHVEGGTTHRLRAIEETELLTICAPAGFEIFQRRAMNEIHRLGIAASPTQLLSTLRKLAPQFGIDLNPPETEWSVDPEVHITRACEGERIAAVGDIYRFLAESEQTSGAYAIWHATIFPGGGPPPHVHHWEEEGFYVLKGTLAFYGENSSTGAFRVEVGPGTFVNLPRHQLHHFHNETDQPAETLILVAPAGLEKMFRKTGKILAPDVVQADKPTTEELSRVLSVAEEFGLEIRAKH